MTDEELIRLEELIKDTKTHLSNMKTIFEKYNTSDIFVENISYKDMIEFIDMKYKHVDEINRIAKKATEDSI